MDLTAGRHDAHPVVLTAPLRTRLAVLGAAVALLLAVLALPSAHSAFSATAGTAANTLTADQLSPPSGLTATQSCPTLPAVAPRGTATTATGGSSVVLSPPATTQAGDVLLAQVTSRYGPVTFGAPGGWTQILTNSSGGQVTSAVYWKIAVASEPAALFSRASGSGDMAGAMVAYSGTHPTAPVLTQGGVTGTGVTATTPSLSATVSNTLVVHMYTKRQEDLPPPTGTTQRWRLMSGNGTDNQGITAADEQFAGPGGTPARASTTSFNAEWIAQSVVLRRPAVTPTVSLAWTPSSSSWATGYSLQRVVGGTVQSTATVTPIGATGAGGGTVAAGTEYTYRLSAYRGAWTSAQAATTITPAC